MDVISPYIFLRIVLGVNFFNHGFTRSMADVFRDTFVPEVLVRIPAMLVPIVEFIGGLLVTLGLVTQASFNHFIRFVDRADVWCNFNLKLGCSRFSAYLLLGAVHSDS